MKLLKKLFGSRKPALNKPVVMHWVSVINQVPEIAGYYLVVVNEKQPHTDKFLNEQYQDEVKIIYYFKERNVTGWQKDWTGKHSDVKYWMPVPQIPCA